MPNSSSLAGLTSRGFAGRGGFGKFPALVVIDFTAAFTTPSHRLGSDVSKEIEETNRLTARFRKTGFPVIYTAIAYDSEADAFSSNWRSKIEGISTLYSGNPDVEQDKRLDRIPEDPVVTKKYASAFFGTQLHDLLRGYGADTIVLAGCSTSGCVRATAVDACQHGYKVVVCQEAVADRHKEAHDQALVDIDLKYGDVMEREEIEKLVEMAHD